jgi:serine/threonine protein kinase
VGTSKDSLIGQVIADRYQVLELIGEGGMGRVYLAEHVRMGRKCAIKVMSPTLALSADAISRFNREASNASRINHPHVAQIYDFGGTPDKTLYLAMELVEGETLRGIIERTGPLAPSRAAEITRQVADALAAAHHLGIVHRDLKPDNIMLARHHDGRDWVKVVDFGIAKTMQGNSDREGGGSQTLTTAGVSLGTPEYMSPEQLAGERLDNRTDLYSLGLVLFNMLTANLPYPQVTSRETLVRRLTSRPVSLSEIAPGRIWPPALQSALDKALAPEPGDRYSAVADFGRDVVNAIAALPDPEQTVRLNAVTAPRTVPPRRPRPVPAPPRSRGTAFLLAGVVLLVGALGAGAFVVERSPGHVVPEWLASAELLVSTTTSRVFARDTAKRGDSATAAPNDTTSPTGADPGATNPGIIQSALPIATPIPMSTAMSIPRASAAPIPKAEPLKRTANPKHRATAVAQTEDSRADTTPSVPDTMAAMRNRTMGQFQHAWLQPNGDSAIARTGPATSDSDRVRLIGGDIRGHMVRAEAFVRQGDVQKARAEYREAVPVLRVLRQLYFGTPAELEVEQMVRGAARQTELSCYRTLSDSAVRARLPVEFRCDMLIPQMMSGQGRRQGAAFSAPPEPEVSFSNTSSTAQSPFRSSRQ